MVFLFNLNRIDMRSVNIGLAAWCSTYYLESKGEVVSENPSAWRDQCRIAIRERLNGKPMDDVPQWAREILATFLHAWLMNSHPLREDFRTIFRRRVFLG
ncbi:hypothetical protein N431DRAFT_14076 [Stipitochalara longipes BDJ]|nr:hypothetical protein N431DRAFT_14076 [Stipitochalara longipes BDJ]